MIVIRRERPQSRNASQRSRPAARRIVRARMLRTAASPPGPERVSHHALRYVRGVAVLCRPRLRKLLGERPHEPGQLARDRHDGDLIQLPATHEPPELAVQAVLGFPRDLEHFGRTSLTALGELPTGHVTVSIVPGRFNEEAAEMAVAGLGDRPPSFAVSRAVLGAD